MAFLFCAVLAASVTVTGSASAVVAAIDGDDTVILSDTKTSATASGTVVCTAGNQVNIQVNVIQTSAGVDAVSLGSSDITCTGQVQTWSVTTNIVIGSRFKRGPATLGFAGFDLTDNTSSQSIFMGAKLK